MSCLKSSAGVPWIVIAVALGAAPVEAAETDFDLSVGAAVSYVYDFQQPKRPTNNLFSYANLEDSDSFNIDLVQLEVRAERKRATAAAKLDLGDLAIWSGDTLDGDVGLQEAYLAYDFGAVLARAGRCETPIGYEALEPWSNTQISRSRAWLLQPINHDGVTLAGGIGPVGVMVGAINSLFVADPAANDTNSDKGGLLSLSSSPGDADFSLTALYSEENLLGADSDHLILNAVASEQIGRSAVAIEANWARTDPSAGETGDTWNLTAYAGTDYRRTRWDLRADYGHYDLRVSSPPRTMRFTSVHLWSVTATFGWILSHRMDARIEYRHDEADSELFAGHDRDGTEDSTNVIQVQLVWYPED